MHTEHTPENGKITAGAHVSFWTDSVPAIRFQPLRQNLQTDVVIVGGGISGVMTAYCLSQAGKRVALVEDGYIGSGETGRTTAHLANALDDRFYELERIFGENISKLAGQSHGSAIDFIEQTVRDEQIDCDFRRLPGYLFPHPSDDEKNIEKEFGAALRAGLPVEKTDHIPGLLVQPGAPGLVFHNQAQFHPLKYLRGMCDAIIRLGGQIYTETRASEIGGSGIVTADGIKVLADFVVVATNAPVTSRFLLPMKQFPFRTYAIGALVEKGRLSQALWWDTGDRDADSDNPPYHYVRTESYNETHDLLICGGEDHPTGLADAGNLPEEKRYDLLAAWARQYFPIGDVVYRWSGQVMEPADSLGYIGHSPGITPDNVFLVSGDSGHGMTHGTIAGMLLTDLITDKENPWEKMYSPSRFNFIGKGAAWIKEWLTGFVQYLTHNPSDKDASKLAALRKDEGTIVKIHGDTYGAYRDGHNRLLLVSAKCTHMGCTVKWNNDEKTWDCPCHGGRYTFTGEVLNGPPNRPLDYHRESDPDFFKHK